MKRIYVLGSLCVAIFFLLGAKRALSAAPLAGCDVEWAAPISGNWSNSFNWTGGTVPNPTDRVCIRAGGAPYTVTLDVDAVVREFTLEADDATFYASSRTFSVNGVTDLLVGKVIWENSTWIAMERISSSVTFTVRGNSVIEGLFIQDNLLEINGTVGEGAQLTVSNADLLNNGTLALETLTGNYASNLVVSDGVLHNAGLVQINAGNGGGRLIGATLQNDGTVSVTNGITLTIDGEVTNNDSFTIAQNAGAEVAYDTFNQISGTLTIDGRFQMRDATFNFNGGTVVHQTYPLELYDSELNIGVGSNGEATFHVFGNSMLSGNIAVRQTIELRSDHGGETTLTAIDGFTNAGTITLNANGSGHLTSLVVSSDTLTNTGVIQSGTWGSLSGGASALAANVVNNGRVTVEVATTFGTAAHQFLNTVNGTLVITKSLVTMPGTLINNGVLKELKAVTGSSDVTFLGLDGYGGVVANAQGQDLGDTWVTIWGNRICNSGDQLVHRCFDISPANSNGRNATLTFYYASSESNGNDCNTMQAYHWVDNVWQPVGTASGQTCTGELYSLTVTGVTDFSPFGLKSGPGPTAVGLTRFQVQSTGSLDNKWLVLVLCALLMYWFSGKWTFAIPK
jgi:hypothetical protein